MLDEFVHHGAEVGLLRDLWHWQHPLADDGLVDRVMRGDLGVVDDLADPATRPDLVDTAAQYARWDLLLALVAAGAPLPDSGRTPLHLAAGAGQLSVVRSLLDMGANPSATDPGFHATPAQWAQFFNHSDVAALLGGAGVD
jgi:hypothetical protein